MKIINYLIISFCLITLWSPGINAIPLKIGVVNLNQALNDSEEGIRSKNILESEGRQLQKELQLEQEELQKQANALRDNLLLTDQAKKEKEADLRLQEQALLKKGQQFEQEIRQKERQMTLKIFNELKAVIRTVAKNEKFDLVLEKTASEVILYMDNDVVDLTDKVIDHYNSLKATQ